MRKKILVFVSLILLLGSYLGIVQLQSSNFTIFNTVSAERIENLKATLQEQEDLGFTALLCNETRVPFDEFTNTFYIPLDMTDNNWEKLEFVSGQPEYQVLFSEDVTQYKKEEVIAAGKSFPLFVYDQNVWSDYKIVFSGLPIIDLTTNEGFYAEEEITGKVSFYDVDFALYGVKQSAYEGHIRGNTSRMFPKKGYKLNLTKTDKTGAAVLNKLSVFGMREDDDWILLALYNDDTKLRDCLSMEVWDRIGASAVSEKAYYGPKMTYVEVVADNRYCGLYGLVEPVDSKQLDLAEEDYSYKRKNPGGLRKKYDKFMQTQDPYTEIEGFEIKDGIMDEDAWEAMAYLSEFLSLKDQKKLTVGQTIINEDSALRMWLFMQIITGHDHTAKNIFYVAKYDEDLAQKYQFYFAPWDMDLTWGNVSVGEINPYYTAFEWETVDDRVYWDTGDWLMDLDYHGAKEKIGEIYGELRNTLLSDAEIQSMIAEFDAQIRSSGAFERDRERWPEGTHADDTKQLESYALERLGFLDKAIYDFDFFEE